MMEWPYPRKQYRETTRVVASAQEPCQAPKCDQWVPEHNPTGDGWIRLGEIEYNESQPFRENYLWFCSWGHLAAWADDRASIRNRINRDNQPRQQSFTVVEL